MGDQIELSRSYIPLLPSQSQAKRKGAGSRTWLVVSKSGQVSVEELGKQTVLRRSGITARDLRVVEPELSYPSAILRRERAVVVNLEHIKAIVTANEVLVPNPRDPRIASFVYDLEFKFSDFDATMRSGNAMEQSPTDTPPEASGSRFEEAPADQVDSRRGNSKPLPFEFRALEICLESVCKSLESETSTLEKEAYPALDQLSAKTSTNNLKRVRVIKGRLVALNGRVQKVRNEFEHLLDDDIDMAQMYLTDKLAALQSEGLVPEDEIEDDEEDDLLAGGAIGGNMSCKSSTVAASDLKPNVEELEMLLGAYFVQIEGILNKLSTLHEYVHNTEDYINIVLDDKQNQLLRMGLVISTATFMITLSVVAIGFLSINIRIPLFDFGTYRQWFLAAGGCSVCSVFLYIVAILVLKWFRFLG
ncbi:magnesium transporter MRS2-F-like [Rhododendron vialii]|uniref:magnesium transporter MRS2-F-like n=1 Tax=Rhododendron vialii TaxID=182163 RepID=UPI00265DF28C|nr:magnesium transporter MRS2-F-like [Rhododendron vialii]